MSLLKFSSITSDGRMKEIQEGSYMYIFYHKLMFPYKHGVLDPVYFLSFNRRYLNYLGASVLAYLYLSLDDWSLIKRFHGEYQDVLLFQLIGKHTIEIINGSIKIQDIVSAVANGREFP